MPKKWTVLFCDPERRVLPGHEFPGRLEPRHRVKILRLIGLLEDMGPTLPRPYADLLHDGVHELRVTLSGEQVASSISSVSSATSFFSKSCASTPIGCRKRSFTRLVSTGTKKFSPACGRRCSRRRFVPTLKRYVASQCADRAFRDLYEAYCEVCPVTVDLAARLHGLGLSNEEAAARFGVTVRK